MLVNDKFVRSCPRVPLPVLKRVNGILFVLTAIERAHSWQRFAHSRMRMDQLATDHDIGQLWLGATDA